MRDDDGSLVAAAQDGELVSPSLAIGGERGLAVVADGSELVAYRLPAVGGS